MSALARSRFVLLAISCLIAAVGICLIVACLFSVSFRTVDVPYLNGKKYFGLFRYCWEPYLTGQTNQMHSVNPMQSTCYLRSMTPDQGQVYRPGLTFPGQSQNSNEVMYEFEKTTLILVVCSLCLGLSSVCFALCTLFSEICALAHSTLLLAATICAASGFGVYTYHNEQPDLLGENDKGFMLPYHYGWAYYYLGIASLLFLVAFLISVFAASVFFYHKRQQRISSSHNVKRTTIKL
ncbi:hypothetical protein PFISCL1PPCAC_15973 [Pristionchus fissidentatus]|uniref:Uncharacterized protein n=1 Tax=Pristionchus fissidentatus TaxID=1538716 RepID=A0AAV5VXX0_9BILA|nr:hypothetical protein PFISCL1PPCAC_15973 [Pristionchus fissidentatus]